MCDYLPKGQVEANKIINDCRFIWQNLPDNMRRPLLTDNVTTLSFDGGGTLQAFPASSKAGRGYTGTEILMDECDFHDEFESSYNALLPLIQDSGGKMFLVSTANPDVLDSPFRQLYQHSPYSLFWVTMNVLTESKDTYDGALDLATDIARFEKENPLNEQQALAPPRIRAFFDVDVLEEMGEDVMEPREILQGAVSIWQNPVTARRYVPGADTAWGRTGSYNVATVLDWQTGTRLQNYMVDYTRRIWHRKSWHYMKRTTMLIWDWSEPGKGKNVMVILWLSWIKSYSYWNNVLVGTVCITMTMNLHILRHKGWQTDGKSRPVMLAEYAEAIRNRLIIVRSRGGISEMLSFIRNEQGRPQAAKGAHDDRVMAYALAWQMRKFAHFSMSGNSRAAHNVPSFF